MSDSCPSLVRPAVPVMPSWGVALAWLALVVPTLLAASDPPAITFYNQALAVLGWGLWMMMLMLWTERQAAAPEVPVGGALLGLSVVLWLCAGSALGSVWATGLPLGLGLLAAGMSLAAWGVSTCAWRAAHRLEPTELMDHFASGLAWAGVIGLLLAVVQVFVPAWAGGAFIAEPTMPGRAVGNLRQPNHFSTLLLWSACGAAWLGRRGRWPLAAAGLMVVMAIGGVVWTASRTGLVATLLMTLWAWRDRGLPRPVRAVLLAAPVVCALWWLGMTWWAGLGDGHAFAAGARLHDGSDISSSRFAIWSNTVSLIRAHPWTGVGWGEFNLAWTFTAFPDRPIAFFDHTHNLVLQWAVELGVPMAVALTALTTWGLWALWWPWRKDADGVMAVTATVVSMAGLHSMLEYPLWYSYFLLPVAFAWALGLAARAQLQRRATQASRGVPARPGGGPSWRYASLGALMAAGAVWSAVDYQWAANIYAPRAWAGPLEQRIRAGQQRLWFGYQADYAEVTGPGAGEPSRPPRAFARTLHNLVDARLMIAYARSLAEHGEVDKARYVVQRLKEFRNRLGREFVAVCDKPAAGANPRSGSANPPFQCRPPARRYSWREILPHP